MTWYTKISSSYSGEEMFRNLKGDGPFVINSAQEVSSIWEDVPLEDYKDIRVDGQEIRVFPIPDCPTRALSALARHLWTEFPVSVVENLLKVWRTEIHQQAKSSLREKKLDSDHFFSRWGKCDFETDFDACIFRDCRKETPDIVKEMYQNEGRAIQIIDAYQLKFGTEELKAYWKRMKRYLMYTWVHPLFWFEEFENMCPRFLAIWDCNYLTADEDDEDNVVHYLDYHRDVLGADMTWEELLNQHQQLAIA